MAQEKIAREDGLREDSQRRWPEKTAKEIAPEKIAREDRQRRWPKRRYQRI